MSELSIPLSESTSELQATALSKVSQSTIDVPKLRGANYLNWRSVISDLIELRGLKKAVFQETKDSHQNVQAKLLLKSTLDEAHLAEVRDYSTAYEIWQHLSRMCIGTNSNDVTLLVRKFYSYQYCAGDAMNTQLGEALDNANSIRNY